MWNEPVLTQTQTRRQHYVTFHGFTLNCLQGQMESSVSRICRKTANMSPHWRMWQYSRGSTMSTWAAMPTRRKTG